jgi:hypothetical protein
MTAHDESLSGKPDNNLAPGFRRVALYGGLVGVVAGRTLIERGAMNSWNWAGKVGSALFWTGLSFFLIGCAIFLLSTLKRAFPADKP